jgi:DNA polymerase III alpha subunit
MAYTATDLPPKGFPITHFDMYGAEDLGIHKFDILSQRGLGHIKDAVELVQRTGASKSTSAVLRSSKRTRK